MNAHLISNYSGMISNISYIATIHLYTRQFTSSYAEMWTNEA